MGEAEQHSTSGGSEEQAIAVMEFPEMGFHGQLTVETTYSADVEEASLTHEEARGGGGGGFPRSRLITGQPRPCRNGLGTVGRCFMTGCYYILTFPHRVRLPPRRKY